MSETQNLMAEPNPSPSFDHEAAANVLYGDVSITHRGSLKEIETGALEALKTPAQAKALADQHVPIFQKYGMGDTDARAYAAATAQITRTPATPEQVADWTTMSKEWLRNEYGDSAGVVLADMQKLIAGDKKFSAYLNKTGLGSHPSVVKALASVAIAQRKAGKLK